MRGMVWLRLCPVRVRACVCACVCVHLVEEGGDLDGVLLELLPLLHHVHLALPLLLLLPPPTQRKSA